MEIEDSAPVQVTFAREDNKYETIRSQVLEYLFAEKLAPTVHDDNSITINIDNAVTHIMFGQTVALNETTFLKAQCDSSPDFKNLVIALKDLLSDVWWQVSLSVISASDASVTTVADMCARGAVKAVQTTGADPIVRCQIIHKLMSIIDAKNAVPQNRKARRGKAAASKSG